MDEVWPNLWVGNLNDAVLAGAGMNGPFFIFCVLEGKPSEEPPNATWIPILDSTGQRAVLGQLDATAEIIHAALQSGQRVLVHCGAGVERSPLTVAWYLHRKHGKTLDEAYALLLSKRPIVQDRQAWLPPEAKT